MRFGIDAPERKEKSNMDVYIKCMIAAGITATIILWLTIGLRYMIELLIEYWYIVLMVVAFVIIVKYVFKRHKRPEMQPYPAGYYPSEMYKQ